MDMPSVPQPPQGDPLGCRAALEEALSAPALDVFDLPAPPSEQKDVRAPASSSVGRTPSAASAESSAAAYQVAVALGRCRLFGVDLGDLDGTLPPRMAVAAAKQLANYLIQWTNDARTLPQRWDDAPHPAEAEEMCLELLEARMETWAAYIALDEAFAEALETPEPQDNPQAAAALGAQMDNVPGLINAFDDALIEQIPLLATAANTELLNNWRALLAQPYREILPWWLDGTLERAADEAYRQMLAELPAFQPQLAGPIVLPLPKSSPAVAAFRRAFARAEQIAAAPEERPPITILRWNSPDETYYAYLPLPAAAVTEIVLSFFTSSDEAATELAGTNVQLDGVESTIDAQGQARFSYEQLQAATRLEALLLVGSDRTAWPVQELEA